VKAQLPPSKFLAAFQRQMDRPVPAWHIGGENARPGENFLSIMSGMPTHPEKRSQAEAQALEPELARPFETLDPAELTTPLVLSSPHSGAIYPARFLAASRLPPHLLRRSEDAHVDALWAEAAALGVPMMKAHFPRAYLDLNREPYELDPRMFDSALPHFANTRSVRVAGGLGTIARIVGEGQDIYAGKLSVDEAMRRIDGLYKPWHHQLRALLRRAQRQFGMALLIDCHSMPSWIGAGTQKQERIDADFVLGDRYGTACSAIYIDLIERILRQCGYQVQRNKPYAGGFITEHYGNPGAGFHAVQIEINRALYMDEQTLERRPHFGNIARDLTDLTSRLMALADDMSRDGGLPLAAE
jgi:N-formylglutamate amidohydrolase